VQYVLSKFIKPDITIDKVIQLDEKEIEKIKQKYGIDGIILDVNETLRKEMKSIPKYNLALNKIY
jgi:predicted HAD superfamily phosphohydrolase YqeG